MAKEYDFNKDADFFEAMFSGDIGLNKDGDFVEFSAEEKTAQVAEQEVKEQEAEQAGLINHEQLEAEIAQASTQPEYHYREFMETVEAHMRKQGKPGIYTAMGLEYKGKKYHIPQWLWNLGEAAPVRGHILTAEEERLEQGID